MRVAGLLCLLLFSPLSAAGAEVVIEAGALTPLVLTVDSDEPVALRGFVDVRQSEPSSDIPECPSAVLREICIEP